MEEGKIHHILLFFLYKKQLTWKDCKDNVPYQLSGTINPGVDLETNWSGTYINEPVITQEASFHYENSNGLNYIRAEVSRVDQWYRQRNFFRVKLYF